MRQLVSNLLKLPPKNCFPQHLLRIGEKSSGLYTAPVAELIQVLMLAAAHPTRSRDTSAALMGPRT
eukprot:4451849-Pyramimonas_sp.AAC.1